ncbi:unnamed protein product [Prorocentrum cordatum]|uniref:Uncharacterized protein n=1 Tax=Prorocentrum cordatum TaxID=2364126 RepID=A0ABN9S0W7_9DINO|nr:unnamed protein product [Polarella glacialis]
MDRPGFSNKNNAVVADARSVLDGDDADGGAAAAGNVDIERAPRQPSPPLQPRRPPLEPPPLEPPRRESSSLRGPPSWSEEPPAAPPPRSPAQPREPPAQAGEPLPQRGEELQDAFLPQDGAPQRLQPGAAVLSAPLSYSGPLLTPPTQDIRSMAEESPSCGAGSAPAASGAACWRRGCQTAPAGGTTACSAGGATACWRACCWNHRCPWRAITSAQSPPAARSSGTAASP